MDISADFKKANIFSRHFWEMAWLKYAEGIEITRLPSNTLVVTHNIPRLLSTSYAPGILNLIGERKTEFAVMVQAGNWHGGQTGLAHFVEEAVGKGSDHVPGMDPFLGTIPGFPGPISAFTSFDNTSYIAQVPSKKNKDAIFVLSDIISHPAFRQEEIEAVRQHVLVEVTDNSMDELKLRGRSIDRLAFNDTNNIWNIGGTPDSVNSITRDNLIAFHNTFYVGGNTVVVAEGKVKHKEAVQMVKDYLDLPPGGRHPLPPLKYTGGYEAKEVVGQPGVHIELLFHYGPGSERENVQLEALAHRMHRALYANLYSQFLVYDVSCKAVSIGGTNNLSIGYNVPPEKVESSLRAIAEVMDSIAMDQREISSEHKTTARPSYSHSSRDYLFHPWKSLKDLLLKRGELRGARNIAYEVLVNGRIKSGNKELETINQTSPKDMSALVVKMRDQRPTILATGNVIGMPSFETICDIFQNQPSTPATQLPSMPTAALNRN